MAHEDARPWRQEEGWTDKRVDRLKELWAADKSCAAIAHDLGGVSRSGVIGKVHRLGLPSREKDLGARNSRKANEPRYQAAREARAAEAAKARTAREALARAKAVEAAAKAKDRADSGVSDAPAALPFTGRCVEVADSRPAPLRKLGSRQCHYPLPGQDDSPGRMDELLMCGAPAPAMGNPKVPPYCPAHTRLCAPKTEKTKAKVDKRLGIAAFTAPQPLWRKRVERRFAGGRA